MRQNTAIFSFVVAVTLVGVGCSRDRGSSDWHGGDGHALSQEELTEVANHELTINVPEACEDPADGSEANPNCENWLGLREGVIGLTHHQQRLSFSIEEVDDRGRFRIAAYPDCNLDARIAAAEAARTPEPHTTDLAETPFYTEVRTGLEDAVTGEAPPLSGDASLTINPPSDEDTGIRETVIAELAKPPFPECRRLIAPGEIGGPVEMLDPAAAGERGWWQMRMKEGERPVFVSMDQCTRLICKIRLLLGENDTLVAVEEIEGQLALKGFFKKLKGSLSKAWNSGFQTVADAAKSVGTVKTVDKLGGKKLYVAAAKPAAKLYSAAKEQGPDALKLADGVVKSGTVYAQVGAGYLKDAGQLTYGGLVYIAEYIQANACFIGVSTGLSTAVAREAAFYEAPLSILAATFAEDLATTAAFDALMEVKEFADVINVAAAAIAIPTSLVSKRFNQNEWKGIIIDILASALTGDVKGGFVGIIIGKIAEAICLGIDKATSPKDAADSIVSANGISDSCLNSIKDLAVKRSESGEDMCYAMQDEIVRAAGKAKPSNKLVEAWESGGKTGECPNDANAEAYRTLLEGIGCKESLVYTEGQPRVDPATNLVKNRYWARTTDWFGTLACPLGQVAVGMCSSGGNPDCYKMPKELLCAKLPSGGSMTTNTYKDMVKNVDNTALSICPTDYVITEFCSSGGNRDCNNRSTQQKIRCRQLTSSLKIDYANCTLKEAKTWDARLQATAPNEVMIGVCTSGKNPDCGQKRDVTKSALFCPINPAAASDGTRALTRFTKGDDTFLTMYIGENPVNYDYDGAIKVYTSSATDRNPLVRCRKNDGKGHMMSNSSGCEGHTHEGILGYTSKTATDKQLVRCAKGDYRFVSTEKQECVDRGWSYASSLGYLP